MNYLYGGEVAVLERVPAAIAEISEESFLQSAGNSVSDSDSNNSSAPATSPAKRIKLNPTPPTHFAFTDSLSSSIASELLSLDVPNFYGLSNHHLALACSSVLSRPILV